MRHIVGASLAVALLAAAFPAHAQADGDSGETTTAEQTADNAPADGQTTSTARLEPAWQDFHDAFVTLAGGEPAAATQLLVRLRADHPDHTTAVFARPVLNQLRDRVDLTETGIPSRSEWAPTASHPAVRDRSSAVYDPTWARYREAFVALAGDDTETARSKLETLRQKAPNHPASTLASEVTDTLDERDPMLVQRQSDMDRGDVKSGPVDEIDVTEGSNPPQPEEYSRKQSPIGLRIAAEGAGGLVGGMAGALGGGLGGYVFGLAVSGGDSWIANSYAGWGSSLVGAAGVPAGVYIAGNLIGARGKLGWTYLGSLAGYAAGTLATFAAPRAAVVTAPLLSLAGPIIGYELSNQNRRSQSGEKKSAGVRIRPVVTPHHRTDSGLFGLHLSF